jgi:3-methyladenine DNA glycosylase AlkD
LSALIDAVRSRLAEHGDPVRAPAMQAYMKSSMPFLGVPVPVARTVCRAVYNADRIADREAWEATVRELFDTARFREERYAALALVSHRYYRDFQVPRSLPLYEHLVVTGAWWDIVDDVARRVGDVVRGHRVEASPVVRRWAAHDDVWLRRTAIIHQLGHRGETDLELLRYAIEHNIDDRDFFIRKAIGWALREYAKHDARWVQRFVAEHPELSALSRREALKHVGPLETDR